MIQGHDIKMHHSQPLMQVSLQQEEEFDLLREKLFRAAAAIPNTTHPDAVSLLTLSLTSLIIMSNCH